MDTQTTIVDLELFKQNWLTYKTIIDENYMFHREIYESAHALISDYFDKKPIAVLDLGCGDASNISKILTDFNISYFCGYDLSALALKSAEKNISKIVGTYHLYCQDMLEGVAQKNAAFNLIFSSYSLHHFSLDDKAAFFRSVYSALKNAGIFVLVDTIKEDNESLQEYREHYLSYAQQHWKALHPEELCRVSDHVRSSDYPENAATLEKLAMDAGFLKHAIMAKHLWHQISVFYKKKTSPYN